MCVAKSASVKSASVEINLYTILIQHPVVLIYDIHIFAQLLVTTLKTIYGQILCTHLQRNEMLANFKKNAAR